MEISSFKKFDDQRTAVYIQLLQPLVLVIVQLSNTKLSGES